MRLLLCLTAFLVLLAGCDRPVVDLAPPRVEVVSPSDLNVVQTEPVLDLALRAEVFGDIDSVTVNGLATAFDADQNVYRITVSLLRGLNVLPVDVFDLDGLRGSDTLYVLHASLQSVSSVVSGSPTPRAGAAASTIPSGAIFLSGGANTDGEAIAEGIRISTSTGGVLSFGTVPLNQARVGHSSSVLPDGRVLLVGGAQSEAPLTLTGSAEVIDVETGAASPVPIATEQGGGLQISRTGHAARLITIDDIPILTLYGGVNAQNVPLNTIDVYRWDDGTLTQLSPPGGLSGNTFPAYALPAEVPIGARGLSEASGIVFGLPARSGDASAFSFDWLPPSGQRLPFDLVGSPISPLSTPRAAAAAVFSEGIVLVSGGTAADGTALDTFEAYVPSVDRTFRFPDSVRLRVPRFDHTATLLSGGRILIVGGRNSSGTALFAIEAFQL